MSCGIHPQGVLVDLNRLHLRLIDFGTIDILVNNAGRQRPTAFQPRKSLVDDLRLGIARRATANRGEDT
ncbi:MAG: hypothetical protein L0H63_15920 [Nitrococcus sp.]|nr:hypothetical protein [Nitrococcus sp.]